MCPTAGSAARDKILLSLKNSGPTSASGLAGELGVTSSAIRQQLCELEADGLIASEELRPGTVGRPHKRWHVVSTAEANACFPDSHASLTLALIAAARSAFGEDGVQKLVAERVKIQTDEYRERIGEDSTVAERVSSLAEFRNDEGYMSGWAQEGDGTFLLWENHCPICEAATECPDLCAGEIDLFRGVLGDGVSVERVEFIGDGDRRCAYRIDSAPIAFVEKPSQVAHE